MTFSFYHSLVSQPRELDEAARLFRLTKWQRFWKLDVPQSMIGLVWNGMMSFGGGWFFLVAAESISVLNQKYALPGIGSYVAAASADGDLGLVLLAIVVMVVMVLGRELLLLAAAGRVVGEVPQRDDRVGRPAPQHRLRRAAPLEPAPRAADAGCVRSAGSSTGSPGRSGSPSIPSTPMPGVGGSATSCSRSSSAASRSGARSWACATSRTRRVRQRAARLRARLLHVPARRGDRDRRRH